MSFFPILCLFTACLFVFPHRSLAGSLYGRRATQSCLRVSQEAGVDVGETGRTLQPAPFTQPFCSTPVLTPLLFHLFLPHPPLPHHPLPQDQKYFITPAPPPEKWTRCKSDKCPSWVGCIVLPLLVFPLFQPVLCPLRSTSDSHVPGVHYQVEEELWTGRKSGKCVGHKGSRGGWRLNSQGGRNREGGGKVGLVGGESELPQNTNTSNGWEIHHRLFNLPDQSAPFTAFSIHSLSCRVKGWKRSSDSLRESAQIVLSSLQVNKKGETLLHE